MGPLLKAGVSLRKGLPVLIRQECISKHSCALSHTVFAFVGPAVRQAFLSVRHLSVRRGWSIPLPRERCAQRNCVKQRPVCHSTSMLTFALFSAVRLHTKLKMCKSECKPNPKTETTICWIIHMKILSRFTHLLTLKLFSSMEHKIWISVEIPECCFQYNNFFVLCRENED